MKKFLLFVFTLTLAAANASESANDYQFKWNLGRISAGDARCADSPYYLTMGLLELTMQKPQGAGFRFTAFEIEEISKFDTAYAFCTAEINYAPIDMGEWLRLDIYERFLPEWKGDEFIPEFQTGIKMECNRANKRFAKGYLPGFAIRAFYSNTKGLCTGIDLDTAIFMSLYYSFGLIAGPIATVMN